MFHSSNPSLFGRPAGVIAEAEALQSTIVELRRLSRSLIEEHPPGGDRARLLLADFSAQLATYFDAEEAGGYFRTIVTDRPDLGQRVHLLEQAHEDLRENVASLRRLAHDGSETVELGMGIEDVIASFEDHEAAEIGLLHEFLVGHEQERCAEAAV